MKLFKKISKNQFELNESNDDNDSINLDDYQDDNDSDESYKWISLFSSSGKFVKRLDGKIPSKEVEKMKWNGKPVETDSFGSYNGLYAESIVSDLSLQGEVIAYIMYTNDMGLADKMIKGKISPINVIGED